MSENKGSVQLQLFALITGFLLLIAKFFAFYLTQSNTILTDALESIINVIAGAFALYSLILSSKPQDINHPYGHGKIEFIAAGIEGTLIFITGIYIIGQSMYNFFYPKELQSLDIGILVTAIAGGINFLLGFFLEKKGNASNSLTLIADGQHLKSDAYSTAGMLIGLAVIYYTGIFWLDNVVALIFGIIIGYTGFKILRRSVAGIMDEADYELLQQLIHVINQNKRENWIDMHNLRVIKYGNKLHIDAHLTLPWYLNLYDSHEEVKMLEDLVNNNFEATVEFFVHTDPCLPISCKICRKQDCPVRQETFNKEITWDLNNLLSDEKHC